MRSSFRIAFLSSLVLSGSCSQAAHAESETAQECDVVVGGGSTAALGAALTAAREGLVTCLVEPTNWAGGQLTASGVPAVDFAWHKVDALDVAAIARDPANLTPELRAWLSPVGNPGGCWVSRNCFEPRQLLAGAILPAIQALPRLHVFYDTVVKRVEVKTIEGTKTILGVEAIQRTARNVTPWAGYDARLSSDMADWYAEAPSARFEKRLVRFTGHGGRAPVVIDATEFGDIMVLSGGAWTQGVERNENSLEVHCDTCGQAFVFTFAERYLNASAAETVSPLASDHPESYGFGRHDWEKIWTYRRLKGVGASGAGQISLQNWLPGNDYPYEYIFRSRAETLAEAANWQGGINYEALEAAERHAWGWHFWFKEHAPAGRQAQIVLATDVLGTSHGLAKFPYLRDVRRSIGIKDFRLKSDDLVGPGTSLTGRRFIDRVATGAYAIDIHPMEGVRYPDYVYAERKSLPFYIPLRALTNRDVGNLLVAGKTMAQTFLANAATRLHPIEYASGIAAGAAAAVMVRKGHPGSAQLVLDYRSVQEVSRKHTPIDWTIGGVSYPKPNEVLEPL